MSATPRPSGNTRHPAAYFYRTKAGDTPEKIGQELYGIHDATKLGWLQEQFSKYESDRPGLYNGSNLNPGYTVLLSALESMPAPAPMCHADSRYIVQMMQSMPESEREAFVAAAWLQQNWNILNATGATALGAGAFLLNPLNVDELRGITVAYERYKAGAITKGQYDYERKSRIERFKARVGPAERLLFPGKTPNEVFRISRSKVIPATAPVMENAARLQTIGRYASRGGVVLSAVGLGFACGEIARADNRADKNKIFAEASTSFIAGTAASVVIGITLAATPVGWIVALSLAAGATMASFGAGKAASIAYDKFGNEIDFVNMVGVDNVCR